MLASGQTICLNMIVKNEAHVVRRCLDSVLPFIDHWVIVDTGSSDGTQEVIREYLQDLPGELHERPWRDFGTNRSEALDLTKGKADYNLIIDADDVLDTVPGHAIPLEFKDDAYAFDIVDGGVVYSRTQLVRSALPWRYAGILHEFVTCDAAKPAVPLPALRMLRNHDGARQKDPETYRRDAALLEHALQTETDPVLIARYRFYLAQSYYDCQQWEEALANYRQRATLGYWREEVFVSLYRAAQIMDRLKSPRRDVIAAYLRAVQAQPGRAEALHALSRFCRLSGLYSDGLHYAVQALRIKQPTEGLYVEPWVYDVGVLDEYAANAYWCGQYWDSLDANLAILATGKLPLKNVQRTAANLKHARDKLSAAPGTDIEVRRSAPEASPELAARRNFPIRSAIAESVQAHPQMQEWLRGDEETPRLGIVIPYRNREAHLRQLLPHLTSFFQRDVGARKIKPLIVISEQMDDGKFNRGWCCNAGALAVGSLCDYFCFHDVDYLPLWADYSYSSRPVCIVKWGAEDHPVRVDGGSRLRITMPHDYFSGAILLDKGQLLNINGYSNLYHGWGHEDGDLKARLRRLGLKTSARDGTFRHLDHDSDGFTLNGTLSEDGLRNKALFEHLSQQYEETRRFHEGLTTLRHGQAQVDFERWHGLDQNESLLICRLRISQLEPLTQGRSVPGVAAVELQ
jgi:glycosyltransferase involved in cell wall biosynthesis